MAKELDADGIVFIQLFGCHSVSNCYTMLKQKIRNQLAEKQTDEYLSQMVTLYCLLGNEDRALSLLEDAYKKRDQSLVELKTMIITDKLRENNSYQKILTGMNFPQERIEF